MGRTGKNAVRVKEVLIAEADARLRTLFCHIVKACGENICIFQTDHISDAYGIAEENKIELMIIDVTMGTKRNEGLDFVGSIRRMERYVFVPVIVVSSYMEDRYAAFQKLHCFGFLQKPVVIEDAARLIKEAMSYRISETGKRYIHLKYGCIVHIVRISEIVYVEHKRREMYVHTRDETIRIPYRTCQETVRQLEGYRFEVCARGKIVNLHYVQSVDSFHQRLVLKAGRGSLSVGRGYMKKIRDALQDL